jgi:hypothetical protein
MTLAEHPQPSSLQGEPLLSTEIRNFDTEQIKQPARSQLIPVIILIILVLVGLDKLAGFFANGGSLLPASWVAFSDQNGRFSVDMPTQPQNVSQAASAAAGGISMCMFRAVGGRGRESYNIGYVDVRDDVLRSATADDIVDGAIAGPSRQGGTLLSKCAVRHMGSPGREAIYSGMSDGSPSMQRIRVYLVGRRLYILLYTTLGASADTPNARRFMDSFKTL